MISTKLLIQGVYYVLAKEPVRLGRLLTVSSFGVAAVLLELVPVASIFFAFTNTVGAALWVPHQS